MNEKAWGIVLLGTGLLYDAWHKITEPRWPGEPVWPLLFRTRRQAVDWKKQAETRYSQHGWKFHVVRVIISVRNLP